MSRPGIDALDPVTHRCAALTGRPLVRAFHQKPEPSWDQLGPARGGGGAQPLPFARTIDGYRRVTPLTRGSVPLVGYVTATATATATAMRPTRPGSQGAAIPAG